MLFQQTEVTTTLLLYSREGYCLLIESNFVSVKMPNKKREKVCKEFIKVGFDPHACSEKHLSSKL